MTPSGGCDFCGEPLSGRQRRFSSPECAKQFARWAWILKVYGLTYDQHCRILIAQGGKCGCCRKPFKPGKTPHIDHEHGGPVRGIVCAYCNTRLIGRLKSADLAQKLADYLTNPPAKDIVAGAVAPGRPKKRRRRRNA